MRRTKEGRVEKGKKEGRRGEKRRVGSQKRKKRREGREKGKGRMKEEERWEKKGNIMSEGYTGDWLFTGSRWQ